MQTDINLAALGICRAANLSLELGNSDAAPENYQSLGMIASARFGHHEKGYRFGKMACDLLERRGWNHFGAGTYFAFATIVPWTRPIMDGIDPAHRAFQMAIEHANPTDAALASRALTSILLASGHPLDQVEIEAEGALEFVLPFGFFLDRISAPLALVRMLRGKTAKFGSLDDGRFTERAFEERATSQPAQAFLECYYWLRKLQARFFAGDYVSAIDAADKVATWYATSPSLSLFMLEKEEYHFYAALARAAPCRARSAPTHTPSIEKRAQAARAASSKLGRRIVRRTSRIVQRWSAPRLLVSKAARLMPASYTSGDHVSARERICPSTRPSPTSWPRVSIRRAALRRLRTLICGRLGSCYLRWGADGKVRQLEQLHPRLRQRRARAGSDGHDRSPRRTARYRDRDPNRASTLRRGRARKARR